MPEFRIYNSKHLYVEEGIFPSVTEAQGELDDLKKLNHNIEGQIIITLEQSIKLEQILERKLNPAMRRFYRIPVPK